ncbi:MAG: HAMP domain-containing histidine kinase [Lachnospiraceae bacterium]|nr:HAMP domain-containing histidine kinase [Lachnospiraceae bacterium]
MIYRETKRLIILTFIIVAAALPPAFLLLRHAETGKEGTAFWLLAGLFLLLFLLLALGESRVIGSLYRKVSDVESMLDTLTAGDHAAFPEQIRKEEARLMNDTLFARIAEEIREAEEIFADKDAQSSRDKKRLKDLMSDISHQIKTPLAALAIYIDIFRKEMREHNAEAEQLADKAESAMERIRWLVSGMLELAQLESGTYVPDKKELPVRETLDKSIHVLESLQRKKGLKIRIESGEEDAVILQDKDWLSEAFQNILKNAIEYAEPQSTITVRITASPMSVMVEITDVGEGIPAEELPKIFNRFYRVKRANGRHGEGVGIGLALARQIIEAHGGILTAESACGEAAYTTMLATFLKQ